MKAINLLIFIVTISISLNAQTANKKIQEDPVMLYSQPKKYINDYENIFTEKERQELDTILEKFYKETFHQIIIFTVSGLEKGENPREFITKMNLYLERNPDGKRLFIVISKNMKFCWIGTKLEDKTILNESEITTVISDKMNPLFKEDKYMLGLKYGIYECINNWP